MKHLIIIATLAFASLGQAAQRINISTKNGMRLSDRAQCQSAELVRYAYGTYTIGQSTLTQNPDDNSLLIGHEVVCEKTAAVPVVKVDETATCVSILEPQIVQCRAFINGHSPIDTTSSGVVFLRGEKKMYQAILSTSQEQNYDFTHNTVNVFDLNLKKIEFNLSSKNFDHEELKSRRISATVLVEDKL